MVSGADVRLPGGPNNGSVVHETKERRDGYRLDSGNVIPMATLTLIRQFERLKSLMQWVGSRLGKGQGKGQWRKRRQSTSTAALRGLPAE
jgi:hypothetical protein